MEVLILFLLILLNGFFALSEIALVSSKKARIEHARQRGSKSAVYALKLLDDSESFLSAIQVGITLIGIVTGVYGGISISDNITPFFASFDFMNAYAHEIALTLTIVVITYVSIVLGELVPKTVALGNPEKIALKVARTIYYFSNIFYPFVRLLSFSTTFFNKILGVKKQSDQLTEAELRQMIKTASFEGVIEEEQNEMHEKVFYFSDKKAKHIMTHRKDVEWVDITKDYEIIKKEIMEMQHTKVVCCKGDVDNFEGVLHINDFYKTINQGKAINFDELIHLPIIIPENSDAQYVLNQFKQKQSHFCCVVNEYGGFEGIITLHDIIENIVGDIPDEGEQYEPDVFVRSDNSVLVSGDAPVETLVDIIEGYAIDFEEIDYSTVAGFVLNEINKIPQIGDKFNFNNYTIEIMDIDGNRIDKILISKEEE